MMKLALEHCFVGRVQLGPFGLHQAEQESINAGQTNLLIFTIQETPLNLGYQNHIV